MHIHPHTAPAAPATERSPRLPGAGRALAFLLFSILVLSGCAATTAGSATVENDVRYVNVRVENRSWEFQRVRFFVERNLVRTVRVDAFQTYRERLPVSNSANYEIRADFQGLASGPTGYLGSVQARMGDEVVVTIQPLASTSDIIVR